MPEEPEGRIDRARKALRVLILEDKMPDLEMILYELRRSGFDPDYEHAQDVRGYVSKLDAGLDIILADYNLPQFDALKALEILQEKQLHIPFIVVTGSISEEAAVACLKSGATDYLLKDRLARLGSAITQALEARQNLEAKLAAEEQTRRRNRELTLLNRIIAVSTESTDEHSFLQVACEELSSALGALHVFVTLLDPERSASTLVAAYGPEMAGLVVGSIIRPEENPMGRLFAELKTPFVLNDLSGNPEMLGIHNVSAHGRQIGSIACVPMMVDGETAGSLALAAEARNHFSEERVDLLKSVADQLSSAMARIRLERERLRLSTAIEQATDAVIITDTANCIQYVNPGFERITGYSRAEVIGKPARFVTGDRKDGDFTLEVHRTYKPGEEWRGRLINRRKDGSQYTVDMSLSPIRDNAGNIVNYVGVQRDVTEELQLEQRYLQAQKMEAIGRLAGGVAHDFNNLLTAILGYADILRDRVDAKSEESADVGEIRRAAERAARLTRQLLAFSRKQIMQPQIVNLNAIVRDMERMLKPLIGDDIEIQTAFDSGLGTVRADPGQLEQVVMNLAVNARDAMPDGGRIMFSTRNEAVNDSAKTLHAGVQNGSYVVLTVSDTGTGISDEALPHLFEPFFTTKEEGKGTGLGLATVYGIVRQSGGYITLSSELGRGTSFEIFLPRLDEAFTQVNQAVEPESVKRGTESILLVEDNEMVRELANKVLTAQGYRVVAAKNPRDAIDYCVGTEALIDMLISDIVMPGMGGKELMERITSLRPGIKVLLISGYADTAFFNDGTREPGTAFLQKPFSPRVLVRTVRNVLDG